MHIGSLYVAPFNAIYGSVSGRVVDFSYIINGDGQTVNTADVVPIYMIELFCKYLNFDAATRVYPDPSSQSISELYEIFKTSHDYKISNKNLYDLTNTYLRITELIEIFGLKDLYYGERYCGDGYKMVFLSGFGGSHAFSYAFSNAWPEYFILKKFGNLLKEKGRIENVMEFKKLLML